MSFRNINLLWEKIMAPRIRFLAVLIQGVYGYPLEPVEDVVMKHPVSTVLILHFHFLSPISIKPSADFVSVSVIR